MKQTIIFDKPPSVVSSAAVGGKMEGEGPLGKYFDKINDDPYLSSDTFEKGESKLQKEAILHMLEKGGLKETDIDIFLTSVRERPTAYAISECRFSDFTEPARLWRRACSARARLFRRAMQKRLAPLHRRIFVRRKDSTATLLTTADSGLRQRSGRLRQAERYVCPPRETRPSLEAAP